MSEPRNNEVQRFELAKQFALKLLEKHSSGDTQFIVVTAIALTDSLLAALDKPKEAE